MIIDYYEDRTRQYLAYQDDERKDRYGRDEHLHAV